MSITKKIYRCGVCGKEREVETNHSGEIYSGCKNCGNSTLHCVENVLKPGAKAKVFSYRLDIENPEDKREYERICSDAERLGYSKWTVNGLGSRTHTFWTNLALMVEENGGEIDIYNRDQFIGQYVADGFRLHDWMEMDFPNKKIKAGLLVERIESV